MSANEMTTLMEMGFSETRAKKALQITGNSGIEPAMNWLLEHPDEGNETVDDLTVKPNEDLPSNGNETVANIPEANASVGEVKSYRCNTCNKLFKTSLEVEFHATKSGHDDFSESTEEKKPLTEEEKKEQLKLLEEKLKEKRRQREEQEKQEALDKEKIRIKSGKELSEARKNLQELEMKKILEQRKREKEEEKLALKRVREQIERDKLNRRLESGNQPKSATVSSNIEQSPKTSQPSTPTEPSQNKQYTETRLQIRLTNGQTMVQTFNCKEQLAAVRLYVEINRTDGDLPFQLMTNFPRKVFTESDYETPLEVLGLIPSAVIIVQKKS